MHYWVFLSLCIATAASPSPAVLLAIKNGAQHGIRRTLVAILGNLTAVILMALISIMGVGAILAASVTLFTLVKIMGGCYLIYLGYKAFTSKHSININADNNHQKQVSLGSLYQEAFIVSITNPKAIAFFMGLFPQFIDPKLSLVEQFPPLVLTFVGCSFFFLALYASLAASLRAYLQREHILSWFNKITGGIFIGFGSALLVSSKP